MGVLMALIIRSSDGLPLTASTDITHDSELLESVRCMKSACRNMKSYPDKGFANFASHVLYFIQSIGVGFLCLCSRDYPITLAYAFLDELQKEFLLEYDNRRIAKVNRPYSFLEFDGHMQKTKQRYNNPGSLSTRVNLSQIQTELSVRPAVEMSLSELGVPGYRSDTNSASNNCNGYLQLPQLCTNTDSTYKLEELKFSDYLSLVLSGISFVISISRALAVMSVAQSTEDDSNPYGHIVMFLCAALCTAAQMYHLVCASSVYRELTAAITCLLATVSYISLLQVTDTWQTVYHLLTAALALTATLYRQPQAGPSTRRMAKHRSV